MLGDRPLLYFSPSGPPGGGTYHPELAEGPLLHPGKSIQGELHPLDQTVCSPPKPAFKFRISRRHHLLRSLGHPEDLVAECGRRYFL